MLPAGAGLHPGLMGTHPSKGDTELTIVRVGTPADFLNNGRVRVSYLALKPGTKYKMQTNFVWVTRDELILASLAESSPLLPRSLESVREAHAQQEQARSRGREEAEQALPARAAHERERKLPQKAMIGERGRQKATRQTSESKVSVQDRITAFPGHSLAIVDGKLCCVACRFFPANKWSSIASHTKLTYNGQATAHAKKLDKWKHRTVDDTELKYFLQAYFESHPDEQVGSKDPDELVYRYRVSESFVAHPPFTGIDNHNNLLQRAGHSIPNSANLRLFIPRIEEAENKLLDSEMANEYIGVSFDGTTRLGEAINTTGRWCNSKFELKKRLLDFTTLETHVNNVRLAAHITNTVMQVHKIPLDHLVSLARDSVSVNGAACRRLKLTFTSAADSLCICHTLCHVGDHFELPTLTEFRTPWLELVGGRDPHAGAKLLWKQTVAPAVVPGYSKVRWYSWAEITYVIAEAGMQRLGEFISKCEERDYGDATRKSLRRIYDQKQASLRLELAAMLDTRTVVKTTYEMEGDRLEILLVWARVQELRALGRSISAGGDGVLPNVDATLRQTMVLKKGVTLEKHFDAHGIAVGTLCKIEQVGSTLYPGQNRDAWLTKYNDGHEEHYEEEELRSGKYGPVLAGQDGKPVLIVRDLPGATTTSK